MATAAQRQASKRIIRRARARWRKMSPAQRARSQPQGRGRRRPGTTGRGKYYRVEVRPRGEFVTFRTQDVGRPGHIQRIAGRRSSGSWATASWLISKQDAHLRNGRIVPDTAAARQLLGSLSSRPKRVVGDRFRAGPTENVPDRRKPTPAQRRARAANIRKAQAARRRRK
jgi:hypothetical protein